MVVCGGAFAVVALVNFVDAVVAVVAVAGWLAGCGVA